MRERVLNSLVTAGRLAELFGRTEQSIMLWRRDHGMPFVRIPGDRRDSIRYDLRRVLAWAKRNGKGADRQTVKEG